MTAEIKIHLENQVGAYRPEDDHRYLSEDALKKFQSKGSHRVFVKLVRKHPGELAFCFRGNSKDSAIIYYKNHAVFHITKSGNVKFNFDHARYMADWRTERDWLEQRGFSFENTKEPRKRVSKRKSGKISVSYSIGDVSMPARTAKKLSIHELEEIYLRIRNIIDSFFAANDKKNHAVDQFRAEFPDDRKIRSTNRELTEKIIQQKLFLSCHILENGYFIYDLEFSQPYGKLLGCTNQPDMLAIRFGAYGKPERLALIEVKSRAESIKGRSGLKEHIRGMENYPDALMPVRGLDACRILNQYSDLGLLKDTHPPFKEAEFTMLSKEILLIFTGKDTLEALERLKQNDTSLLRNYTQVTAEFSCLSDIEPAAIYRREL